MNFKIYVTLVPCLLLVACDQCEPPPLLASNSLTGWRTTNPNAELREVDTSGGVLTWFPAMGFEAAADDDSVATKTFDCGSGGSNCNVSFSMAAPTNSRDGESMTVLFTYDGTKTKSITFHRQAGDDNNPVLVSLPACGSVSVKVSVEGGPEDGMQNKFLAGPWHYECSDCVSENGGANGN
jgi:hypothetical protein